MEEWKLDRSQDGADNSLTMLNQLKKYGDSRTSSKLKSPRSGNEGKLNAGKDVSKLSSNWPNKVQK